MRTLHSTKEVGDTLGRSAIAARLGASFKTVSAAVCDGLFPAWWYCELKAMGHENGIEIPDELFRMKWGPARKDGGK